MTVAHISGVEVPFLGLRHFDEQHMHLFFGREEQIGDVVEKLANSRLVSVIGSSGSGKSSLVRAGVVPALKAGLLLSNGPRWRVILMRPGGSPISSLAIALERSTSVTDTETTLRRGPLGLIEAVEQAHLDKNENLLLIVDQFEELFRYRSQQDQFAKDESASFVKLLLEATSQQQFPIYVLITMRSDYLGDCSQFRDLPERINSGLYLVPRMRRDQMEQAITGPVAIAEAEISRRLVQRLLNDTGDDPDQLPVLQHALLRAWNSWNHAPRPLDYEDLDAVGGLAGSLTCHADEVYNTLDERGKQIAKIAFQRLSERDKEGREIRRPAPISDIAAVAGISKEEVEKVIQAFAAPEVALLYVNRQGYLDITHESLLRKWIKIAGEDGHPGWLQEETSRAEEYRRLVTRSQQNDVLARRALKEALDWRQDPISPAWATRYTHTLEEFANVLTFIERSREVEEQRERARKRLWAIVIAAIILAIVVLALATVYSFHKAKAARAAATLADADRLAATSVDVAGSDKDLALLLAVQAYRMQQTRETRQALMLAYESSAEPALRGHSDVVDTVAVANNGNFLATASEDGTAALWDWNTHRQIQILYSDSNKKVYAVAFAPDGKQVALGLSDGTVAITDRDSPGHQTTLQASQDAIADVAFSPRGDRFATASSVRSPAVLWDFPALTLLAKLDRQKGKVNRVAFNQQGRTLATASSDRTVIIWDSDTGTPLRVLSQPAGATDVSFSPDGKWIAASSSDGAFSVWNSDTGALLFRRTAHMNRDQTLATEAIAYSSDGKEIATLASNGQTKIWNAETGTERLLLTLPNAASPPGRSIVFRPLAPDQIAIAAGRDVWLYDLNLERIIFKSEALLSQMNFRPEDCFEYLRTKTCPVFQPRNR